MISAVLCSWWTNYSFKRPLLCSAVLLSIGNLLYALAYDMPHGHSGGWNWRLAMLLGGRFICGLGGARALNRRYIADLVSLRDRTRASGAFVAAGAVGMALGPGSAAVFAHLDVTFAVPAALRNIVPRITLNALTAPGWIMFVVWVIFFVVTLCFFLEPAEAIREAQRLERELEAREHSRTTTKRNAQRAQREQRRRTRLLKESAAAERGVGRDSSGVLPSPGPGDASAGERGRLLAPNRSAVATYTDVDSDASVLRRGARQGGEIESSSCCWATFCKRPDEEGTATARCDCICLRVPCPTSVWVTMLLIFWLKGVQEAFLTSIPLVSRAFFNWRPSQAGILMAILGLSILPANSIMGWLQAPSLQCTAFVKHFGACIVALLRCGLSCVGIESKCLGNFVNQVHDFAPGGLFGEFGEGGEEESDDDETDTVSRASRDSSASRSGLGLPIVEEDDADGRIGMISGRSHGDGTSASSVGGGGGGSPSHSFRGLSDRWGLILTEILGIFGLAMFLVYPLFGGASERERQPHPSFGWGGLPRYTAGATIFYIARNLMEGLDMSLMSKMLPARLARGTCNSGLITTEVGTFGRALGNMVITVAGLHEANVATKRAVLAAAAEALRHPNATHIGSNATTPGGVARHHGAALHHSPLVHALDTTGAELQNMVFVPALFIDVMLFILTVVLFHKLKTHEGARV